MDEEEGEIIYDYDVTKARDSIKKLMNGNYGGGKRKRKRKSIRKTLKNKRK